MTHETAHPHTLRVAGLVLCGGLSTRMGQSKAWLAFDGETLLQRMVRLIGGATRPVLVAAGVGQDLPELPAGIEVVRDRHPDYGPLAGLEAGLSALQGRTDMVFVTPCDHPLLRPALIDLFVSRLETHQAVVATRDGRMYPLLGVYRASALAVLQRLIAAGERRAWRLAEALAARQLHENDLRTVDGDLASLENANDPQAFAQLVRRAAGGESPVA